MALITGIINGLVTTNQAGETVLLPFANTVEEATFSYTGELVMSETFNASGVKSASAACLMREEASFTMTTKNITWSFLQAAAGHIGDAATLPIQEVETVVLRTLTTGNSTVTLAKTPATGEPIIVADTDGVQYEVTVSGSVVTFTGDLTGKQVVISYYVEPSAGALAERQIQIGKSDRITNIGIYGRFRSCGKDLLIVAKNAVIQPGLEFGVGSDAASATITAMCLQDLSGTLATIVELND